MRNRIVEQKATPTGEQSQVDWGVRKKPRYIQQTILYSLLNWFLVVGVSLLFSARIKLYGTSSTYSTFNVGHGEPKRRGCRLLVVVNEEWSAFAEFNWSYVCSLSCLFSRIAHKRWMIGDKRAIVGWMILEWIWGYYSVELVVLVVALQFTGRCYRYKVVNAGNENSLNWWPSGSSVSGKRNSFEAPKGILSSFRLMSSGHISVISGFP